MELELLSHTSLIMKNHEPQILSNTRSNQKYLSRDSSATYKTVVPSSELKRRSSTRILFTEQNLISQHICFKSCEKNYKVKGILVWAIYKRLAQQAFDGSTNYEWMTRKKKKGNPVLKTRPKMERCQIVKNLKLQSLWCGKISRLSRNMKDNGCPEEQVIFYLRIKNPESSLNEE